MCRSSLIIVSSRRRNTVFMSVCDMVKKAITRLIFNYNLNSPERLGYLKECVKKTIPRTYPEEFVDIVDEIFAEINESLKAAKL